MRHGPAVAVLVTRRNKRSAPIPRHEPAPPGAVLLILIVGIAVFSNSFEGAFVFDDTHAIIKNNSIRYLWPPARWLEAPPESTAAGRPLVNLSLAVNFALGGLEVRIYHYLNLAIHLTAALLLFGLLRRTLAGPRLKERFAGIANRFSLAATLFWTVHPLQTASVTYISQRAESLMGFFYLLTLYLVARGFGSPAKRWWHGGAMLACAFGMLSKEVMATAPLVVLLYERAFWSGSVRKALIANRGLYAGLAATWVFLAVLVATGPRVGSVGLRFEDVTPGYYAKTQAVMLLHYLRLCFLPEPLVLDYGWPPEPSLREIAPQAAALFLLLCAAIWSYLRRPEVGFLGAWFFLILAPSSSFLPIRTEVGADHRMYLPLAAVAALVVTAGARLGNCHWLRRVFSVGARSMLGAASVFAVTAALGFKTYQRNEFFQNPVKLWSHDVSVLPDNPRAQYNLGLSLVEMKDFDGAERRFVEAIRIRPGYADAHYNLGVVVEKKGDWRKAKTHYERALRVQPNHAEAHHNLGVALVQLAQPQEAIRHFEKALATRPGYALAHNNLGEVLEELGKPEEAAEHFAKAVRFKSDYARAHNNLGVILTERGNVTQAARHFEAAVRFEPAYADAHYNLGVVLEALDRSQRAMDHYREALRLEPDHSEARNNLGVALGRHGRHQEAIPHFQRAVQLDPDNADVHFNLGLALASTGEVEEALVHYREALRLDPGHVRAREYPEVLKQ